MTQFNFIFDPNVSLEQRIGFEMAAAIWSQFLTDDVTINLRISGTDSLENDQAVGGAVPIFYEVNYGVYQAYLEQDATSAEDQAVIDHLQEGNTVDALVNGEVVDGNTTIMLTAAQMKALGMDGSLVLADGSTWDRDVIDGKALDGYIVVNNSYAWSYDLTRQSAAADGTLDFLTMALHEIGHSLGFVSGIDGLIKTFTLHSGETRTEGMTALDLLRYSDVSAALENPDGAVSDLTEGTASYFSLDGGATSIATFSTGQKGDGYQASHWKRFQHAIGIMDPTLGYKERTDISYLDLQSFDALGWDVDYSALASGLNLASLYEQAVAAIAADFKVTSETISTTVANGQDWYAIGYGTWWQSFKDQMIEIGYGTWWQEFEAELLKIGWGSWWQAFEETILEVGYGGWWQAFEEKVLEIGYGGWWQEFEATMMEIGYGTWWQVFEIGYGTWWLQVENHIDTLNDIENGTDDDITNGETNTVVGGKADDILAGGNGRDLISGDAGDDLLDGKAGDDILIGDEGNDIAYGWDGNDALYGGQGNDFLAGEDGDDRLYGEAGHDILSGGRGHDYLSGGEGRDVLKGDTGNDVLDGGTGEDDLMGGSGNDILIGGQGQDVLNGGDGDDELYGDSYTPYGVTTNTSTPVTEKVLRPELAATTPVPLTFWVRIEAENLELDSYNIKTQEGASGAGVIVTGGEGKAKTTFTGPDGLYTLVIGYYDDNANSSQARLKIGGRGRGNSEEYAWTLNRGTGSASTSNNFVTYTVQVSLKTGDEIEFRGDVVGNEYVRLDYIDIIQTNSANTPPGSKFYNGNFYALGGSGAPINTADPKMLAWLKNTFGTTTGITQTVGGTSAINMVGSTKLSSSSNTRLEAEAMALSGGYLSASREFASSGVLISNLATTLGKAATTITGQSGMYNIYASYFDSSTGNATAKVLLNGLILSSWQFDANNNEIHKRAIGLNVILNEGDILEIQGMANGGDQAQIDYLELEKVKQTDRSSNPSNNTLPGALRVEAEHMTLTGTFKVENGRDFASGATIVKSDDKLTGFTATTQFAGVTGLYDIVIGYYDEADGLARYMASLEGSQLATWQSNLQLGDNNASAKTFMTRTLRRVLLNHGDTFSLQSIEESGDKGYIDYVEFVPHNPNAIIRVEAEHMTLSGDYDLKDFDFASRGRTVRSKSEDSAKRVNFTTPFSGKAGTYDIIVSYYDENDGLARFTASIGGLLKDSWVADKNLGSADVARQTLTTRVIKGVDLNPGDTFRLTSQRQGKDEGQVDYIEFVPVAAPRPEVGAIQIEAEQMDLSGKAKIIDKTFAYGGGYVQSEDDATGFRGTALFEGETGYYNVVVGYYDGNDGAAEIAVRIGNKELNRWYADQDLGDKNAGVETFTTHTVATAVKIRKTDLIEISAIKDGSDRANIDYIKFIPVEAPQTPTVSSTSNTQTGNGDIMRGGAGNDILHGGEGDDILYGEEEFDVGNAGGNDILIGGVGNDILYGNSGNDTLYGDEVPGAESTTQQTNTITIPNGVTYNGSLYVLTDSVMTWLNAQAYAESLGGNLVTINDSTEENWIRSVFGTSEQFWIGLNDQAANTQFKWVSGEALTYTNFEPGRIDDPNRSFFAANHDSAGAWADEDGAKVFRGLVEIKLDTSTSSAPVAATPTAGNDQLTGGRGNDTLDGGGGND
ncbi:hypothetical protein C7271_07210, partial [filamentous cyanobacterium CCP5]